MMLLLVGTTLAESIHSDHFQLRHRLAMILAKPVLGMFHQIEPVRDSSQLKSHLVPLLLKIQVDVRRPILRQTVHA